MQMDIELQPHNGCIGRNDNSIASFGGWVLSLEKAGIVGSPIGQRVRLGDRIFTYAYTVLFDTNGFFVFRETVR